MDETTSRRSAVIALVVLSLIWGINWSVMKSVLQYVGPMTFSAYRYIAATIILFIVLIIRRESLAPTPFWPTLSIGLMQTAGFQAFVQWSLIGGGAGKMALIAYTMPFWVIPLAWMLLGEKPASRQWLFIALAACGLVLIFEPWRVQPALFSALIALAGGFCWAMGTVLSKKQFQTTGVSLLRLTAWQMAFGSVGSADSRAGHSRARDGFQRRISRRVRLQRVLVDESGVGAVAVRGEASAREYRRTRQPDFAAGRRAVRVAVARRSTRCRRIRRHRADRRGVTRRVAAFGYADTCALKSRWLR